MIEIKGKHSKDVKVFIDNVEDEAISQIYALADHPAFEGAKIRIMPDTHAGKGIVIGFSCPLDKYVSPAHVGCDIGCQMTTLLYKGQTLDDVVLTEHQIKKSVPMGFEIHDKKVFDDKTFYKYMNKKMSQARSTWPEMVYDTDVNEKYVTNMLQRIGMDAGMFYKSLGTLGGGNHFMEIGTNEDYTGFTVHCGSRNFGLKVFKYWEKVSKDNKPDRNTILKITAEAKANCKDKMKIKEAIDKAVGEYTKNFYNGYLTGEAMKGYITDLFFAQAYASFNHECIVKIVTPILAKHGLKKLTETVNTVHNYIDPLDHIIRKGAVRAYEGEKIVIPFNMRDGLAICEGKSNDDWNCTAPHGAGRIMSRAKAKETISLDEYTKSMEGIYTTCVNRQTIDESPMAYKDMNVILECIKPTADVLFLLKPIVNLKAGED